MWLQATSSRVGVLLTIAGLIATAVVAVTQGWAQDDSRPGRELEEARYPACYVRGVDWGVTNNIPNGVGAAETPSECHGRCRDTEGCYFWTYHHPNKSCSLKRDVMKDAPQRFEHLSPRFPDPIEGTGVEVVSGARECSPALRWFTEEDLLRELRGLAACKGVEGFAKQVERCMQSVRPTAPFHHWQARHLAATYSSTYPHREWETCALRKQRCTCYTTVRYGYNGSWSYRNMTTASSPVVRCHTKHFPRPHPTHPSSRCECWTPPAGKGLYLTTLLHTGRPDSSTTCDIPLAAMSPLLDTLAYGWGESAIHIALALTAHCTALPGHASVSSWKQDEKGYPLPCSGLTGVPFADLAEDTGVVYSMAIPHWQRIPIYLSQLLRSAVRGCFGVDLPSELTITSQGNRDLEGWEERGWTHPCCQYMVMSRAAHRSLAQFTLLIAIQMARILPITDQSTAAVYCLLWYKNPGGCVKRWFGYLGEIVSIIWGYMTQRFLAVPPKFAPCWPNSSLPTPAAHRRYHGLITHSQINMVYDMVVHRGKSCPG